MKRFWLVAVVSCFALLTGLSHAGPEASPDAVPSTVPRSGPTASTSELQRLRAEAERAWWQRYEQARQAFVHERYEAAARAFEALRITAPGGEQQRLALEFEMAARALSGQHQALRPDQRRTPDELSLLYSTAFIYGFGTSAWVSLVTEPQSFVAAVLPFAVITTGSVGAVAVSDGYRPFPLGVPHAIASGAYIGLAESIWIVGLQHARATSRDEEDQRWTSAELSTVIWSSTTLGGIAGGVIGYSEEPLPGRSSYVTSSALWGGAISALAVASFGPDPGEDGTWTFGAAGVGTNLGLLTGLLTAKRANPGVARMRLVDLGGLGGGLLGAGAYAGLAGGDATIQSGFGASAIGAATGLGLVWWLTSGMPDADSMPGVSTPLESVSKLTPVITPERHGVVFGVAGSL